MLPDLFFTINYWIVIGLATISLILCLLFIVIIITHRECHNSTNLLACNTCVAVAAYFIFRVVESIYALRGDWQYHQSTCVFRAYCILGLTAALCYSFPIQTISRLFFAVLYKHKFLLTWRAHWIMIMISWIISFIIPIEPLLLQNGFKLRIESRNCVVSSDITSITMYLIVAMFVVPINIMIIIYGVILHHVHQSTRRIVPTALNVTTITAQGKLSGSNGRRELKIIQRMFVQTTIISCGGMLYLILAIWNAIQQQPPPESFYLLSFELISISTVFNTINLFVTNNTVKKIVFGYIFRKPLVNMERPRICQPMVQVNV